MERNKKQADLPRVGKQPSLQSLDRLTVSSPSQSSHSSLTIQQLQEHTEIGHHKQLTILPPIAPTPDTAVTREQTQSSQTTNDHVTIREAQEERELEWYQQQLYELLGEDAREFLHPKMMVKRMSRKGCEQAGQDEENWRYVQ